MKKLKIQYPYIDHKQRKLIEEIFQSQEILELFTIEKLSVKGEKTIVIFSPKPEAAMLFAEPLVVGDGVFQPENRTDDNHL